MHIRFIGTHNTKSRKYKLSSFIIDDILAIDAGSISTELSFAEQKNIQAIILSHGHYDHICDIPAFAFANIDRITRVYGSSDTLEILKSHLLDGIIYPKLAEEESFLGKTVLDLVAVNSYQTFSFEDYEITAVPVNHALNPFGFDIQHEGKSLFYTGDTGPGLEDIWQHVNPNLLISDVTFPNKLRTTAESSDHLCPQLLAKELKAFNKIKGYIPQVVAMHISPQYENEIKLELRSIAAELKTTITVAKEGDKLSF